MLLPRDSAPTRSLFIQSIVVFALFFSMSNGVFAQSTDAVERRLNDVKAIINGEKMAMEDVFEASFLAAVSPAQLTAGVQQLTAMTGRCEEIHISSRVSEHSVKAAATTSGNYSIPISLTVSAEPPFKIIGLFLQSPVKLASSLSEIEKELAGFEGQTSIYVFDVTKNAVLSAKDTARSFPIGSTFKLFILGDLVHSINQRKHRWDEVVALNRIFYSQPSGFLQTWPNGSPITLHTLASLMISQSDNTATDHLLQLLGRESVEQIQFSMGNTHSSANIPFLSTLEMFKLKFTGNGAPARIYANAEIESKREQLTALDGVSRDSIVFTDKPVLADQVEWFASTPDACRAMLYLKDAANKGQHQVMDILGINRGLDIDKDRWPVVGFKGGSETGVLNFTYYLQRKDGREFVLSASWLNTEHDVKLEDFTAVIGGAVRVLAAIP